MSDPNLLDLDALEAPTVRSITHRGKRHDLVPINVEAWLANLKDVRELQDFMERDGLTPDVIARAQMDLTIRSIVRSYPSFPEAELRVLSLDKLDAIVKFTRALDGSDKVEAAMKAEAEANPPQPSPETTTA